MQISSVYACSAIFDEKIKVIEDRQKNLKKQLSICMMHLKSWRIDMTRKEVKEMLPVLQAYAEGKEIEIRSKNTHAQLNGWAKMDEFIFGNFEYRIKPEPKYRPFANAEECWQEMQKHKPFGWVKEKHSDRYSLITEVNGLSIKVKEGCLFTDSVKYYTFVDGTPFGVKVEE